MRAIIITLSILLVLTLFLCMLFAYLWIDRSITLSYVYASLDSEVRARAIITEVIKRDWCGKPEDEVYHKLLMVIEKYQDETIVLKKSDDGKGIEFDNFHFQFDNGKLKNIE